VLGLRETVQKVKERGTQLLKRRERQLHLRFDAGRPSDPKLAPSFYFVLEQRGLADACFAVHDQHAAAPDAQQSVEDLTLAFTAEQLPS
jgi:hypothetical protein